MKSKRNNRFLCVLSRFLAAPAIIISFFGSAHGGNLDWDITPGTVGIGDSAITGGLGAWDTTNGNWTADAGANNVAWNNANNDLAIFGGTGGAVALGTGITANGLTFNTTGYSITGNTLTLAGTTPTITTNADATVSSILAGASATLTKAGTGQLTLTGVNTFAGPTTISAGTLRLGNGTINPTVNGNYSIGASTTLKLEYNTGGSAAQTWSKFTGAGTLVLSSGKTNFDTGWASISFGTGFTGTLRVEQGRVYSLAATANTFGLGGITKVVVRPNAHYGMWEAITLPSTVAFEIEGTGYGEATYESAIRMANGSITSTINGPVSLTGSAAISAGGTGVINGVISGASGMGLTIGAQTGGNQAGTVALGGANTYLGDTTVTMGTLRLDNQLALQNSTLSGTAGAVSFNSTVSGNAFTLGGLQGSRNLALTNTSATAIALTLGNNSAATSYSGVLSGLGSLIKTGSGTSTLTGANTYAGVTTVNNGTLEIGGAGSLGGTNYNSQITIGATGTVNFNSSATQTWRGGFSGSGILAKNGSGTLTLDGASTGFSGAINVNTGALGIRSTLELGIGSSLTLASGTSLAPAALSDAGVAVITSSLTTGATASSVTIDASKTLFSFSTTPSLANPVILPVVVYDNPTIGGGGFSALSLTLSRNLIGSLVNNTQELDLQVTGYNPTTWVGNVNNAWDINTTSNWTLNAAATTYQESDIVLFNDSASGSGAVSVGLNATINPGSVTFNNATRDYTISGTGAIAGSAAITKSGAATLTLGTNNTFTGALSLLGGTLKAGHANALGTTASGTTVTAGATLDLNGIALAAEPLTLNGAGVSAGGALVNNSGTAASTAATIALFSDSSIGGSGSLTLSGAVSGSAALSKVGAGTVVLSANNGSLTGDVAVSGGVLRGNTANAFGSNLNSRTVTINGGSVEFNVNGLYGAHDSVNVPNMVVNSGASLVNTLSNNPLKNVTLNNATLTSTQGAGTWGAWNINGDITATGNSTISTSASLNGEIMLASGSLVDTNFIIPGAGDKLTVLAGIQTGRNSASPYTARPSNLIKSGNGTLVLAGTNAYTGTTTVSAGTLVTSVSQSSSGFTVADGSTLGITGAAGSSLSTGAMTLGTSGSTTVNINNFGSQLLAANAPVKVTGALTLNGTSTLNVSGNFTGSGTFPVLTYGSMAGPANFALGSIPRSATATLTQDTVNKVFNLNVTAVNPVYWNGNVNGNWNTSTNNWLINAVSTAYQDNDMLIMDDSATGTTSITLNSIVTPSSLSVNNTTKNYSIAGTGGIAGSFGLTKSGAGSLTLATANTYSGGTTVSAGTLQLGNGTLNGSVLGNIVNNASLVLNNPTAVNMSGIVSGTGTLAKQGAGTFSLTAAPTCTGATTISAGTLDVPALTATSSITDNSALSFTRTDTTQTNVAGVIAGSGSVLYNGPVPAVSLAAQYLADDANTYSGTTTISNSRVNVAHASGLGTGAVIVNNGGGIITSTTNGMVINNPITVNGLGWNEGAFLGAIRLTASATLAGPITLASDSRIGAYGGAGMITGAISGNANLEFFSQSAQQQTVTLSGSNSNTYTGTTTCTSGITALGKSGGAVAIPGPIVMDSVNSPSIWISSGTQFGTLQPLVFTGTTGNARFNLMGNTQTFSGLTNAASTNLTAVIQNSESGWSPLNGATSNLVLNVASGGDFSYLNGYLRNQTGVVNLVKNGLGRQTLGGGTVIDYSGTTAINAGELRFYDMDDTQSRAITIASGATLRVEALTTRNFAGNVFGGATWSGTGTLIMTGAGIKQFNGNAATNISFGSGALVDVQAGVLRLGFGSVLNMTANRADLNVASGATFNNWDCANTYVDALTGSGTVTRGYTPDTATTSTGVGNFIVGMDNGSGSFTGVISDQVSNAGSILNLVKRGSGTQTLSGVNDYDGTTRIEGGTLALSGSGDLPNTTSVTVLSGSVFDLSAKSTTFTQPTGRSLTAGRSSGSGNDIIGNLSTGGSVSVAGSGAAGTLTVSGNLALTGGGSLALDVSPSVASGDDKIAVAGNLTLAGTTTVNPLITGTPDTTNPYTIMTYGGTLTGDATNLSSGLSSSRYTATFSTATAGQVTMSLAGIGKALTWTGATNTTWSAPTTLPDAPSLNWTDGASQNFQNLDSVLFDDTASGTGAVTVAITGTLSPSVMTVNNPTRAYTLNGAGTITGGGKLTKIGAASLIMSTVGTFSGGTVINEGTISLGVAGSIEENVTSLGSGPIAINTGGTLKLDPKTTGNTYTFPNEVTLNGGTLWGNDGIQRFTSPLTLGNSGTNTIKPTWSNKPMYLDGGIGGTGNLLVTGQSGGTGGILHLTTPNTYVGIITVDNSGGSTAALYADHNAALGTAAVVLGNSGNLVLGGNADNLIIQSLSSTNANAKVYNADATSRILTHSGTADVNFTGTLGDGTANGVKFSLVKANTGKLTLSNANTFTGQTRLLGGTLALANSLALSGSTLLYDNEGGSLDVGTLTAVTVGGLQGSQNWNLVNTSLAGVALTVGATTNSDNTVYTGALSGTGASFTKAGVGSLTLGGSTSNTYTGNTTVNTTGATGGVSPYLTSTLYLAKTGGAIAIPPNTTFNYGTVTANQANLRTLNNNQFGSGVVMNFANATGNWCRFDLMGTSQTLAGISGGTLTTQNGAVIQNSGLDGNAPGFATLTLNGNTTDTLYPGAAGYIYNGYLRDTDGGINYARSLSVIKNGTGKQTLMLVAGGFSGSLNVNAGTLTLGSQTTTTLDYVTCSSYNVATGATLDLYNGFADQTNGSRLANRTADITGTGSVIKTGTGKVIMANNSGPTQVHFNMGSGGLIDVQAGRLDSISTQPTNRADLNIAAGGYVLINGAGASNTTAYFDALTGGNSTTNATLEMNRTTVFGIDNSLGACTFFGNITGTGGLTKEGSGTMTLTAANSVTVPIVPTSASTFAGNITVNGGKLVGAAVGSVFGAANNARVITLNAGTTVEFQAPNTFGNHNSTAVPTLVVNNGTVTNSDPLASNKVNNALRNVTLTNGTLTATVGNGTSDIDATNRPGEGYGCWGLNGTVTSTGISTISSSATGKAGRILLSSSTADTTMNVTSGTLTVSAPLQTGDSSPAYGLIKSGAGKLVLSAVNVHSTPTTVSAGTLELSGSMVKPSPTRPASDITVASGATLMGNGSAVGTLAANGIVAPGASIGTLSMGGTTFGATGSLNAEINSSTLTADKLAVAGNLNITAGAALNVADLGSGTPATAKLVLISYTGTWDGGTFAGLANNSPITVGGNTYTIKYNDTDAGVNAVTLRIGSADPFDAWASGYGLTGPNALKGADPDNDGVKNILEFATASDPTSGSSGPRVYPLMFTIGADNALTFTTAVRKTAVFAPSGNKQTATKDMLLYTVEASNDLVNWTAVQVTEVTGTDKTNIQSALGSKLTAPPLGADWEWHTFRTDQGAQVDPSDHIRLQVTEAP